MSFKKKTNEQTNEQTKQTHSHRKTSSISPAATLEGGNTTRQQPPDSKLSWCFQQTCFWFLQNIHPVKVGCSPSKYWVEWTMTPPNFDNIFTDTSHDFTPQKNLRKKHVRWFLGLASSKPVVTVVLAVQSWDRAALVTHLVIFLPSQPLWSWLSWLLEVCFNICFWWSNFHWHGLHIPTSYSPRDGCQKAYLDTRPGRLECHLGWPTSPP